MKKRGFTIVELLIYIGLLSILLVVLTEIFLSILDLQSEGRAVSSVAQDGRFLIARLNYDLRRSSSITEPATLGETSTNAIVTIDGNPYTFAENGGNLVLTTDGSSENLNSEGSRVTNLTFTRLGNVGGKNSLQIKFKLKSAQILHQGSEMRNYETTVSLR